MPTPSWLGAPGNVLAGELYVSQPGAVASLIARATQALTSLNEQVAQPR